MTLKKWNLQLGNMPPDSGSPTESLITTENVCDASALQYEFQRSKRPLLLQVGKRLGQWMARAIAVSV